MWRHTEICKQYERCLAKRARNQGSRTHEVGLYAGLVGLYAGLQQRK